MKTNNNNSNSWTEEEISEDFSFSTNPEDNTESIELRNQTIGKNWNRLPEDLLGKISSYFLEYLDYFHAYLVCTRWNKALFKIKHAWIPPIKCIMSYCYYKIENNLIDLSGSNNYDNFIVFKSRIAKQVFLSLLFQISCRSFYSHMQISKNTGGCRVPKTDFSKIPFTFSCWIHPNHAKSDQVCTKSFTLKILLSSILKSSIFYFYFCIFSQP